MLIILIPILTILAIILFVLKKKNIIDLKFNVKNVIIILLILFLLFVCFKIFVKRYDIIFFFQSLEYKDVDKYDYSNDIANNGCISKEGAIKIAKENTNKKRIAKVTCDLVENGTYIEGYDEIRLLKNKTNISTPENQATYWLITLVTGWDNYMHEERWTFKIDYYTGEILQYYVPIYD